MKKAFPLGSALKAVGLIGFICIELFVLWNLAGENIEQMLYGIMLWFILGFFVALAMLFIYWRKLRKYLSTADVSKQDPIAEFVSVETDKTAKNLWKWGIAFFFLYILTSEKIFFSILFGLVIGLLGWQVIEWRAKKLLRNIRSQK